MAFTTRAPRRNELSLSDSRWQDALSPTNLKSNLKLVKNYHEWRSIYKSFKDRWVIREKIIEWIGNQQYAFRTSYLHYLLISGYLRECNVVFFRLEYAPKDIQDIILSYGNLLFIKLHTKSHVTLRTFDCNLTINNLAAILKQDSDYKDCSDLRLWTRYDTIKFIYSVDQRQYTHLYLDDEGLRGDKEKARWVQIPRDNAKELLFTDLDDKLEYPQVLEFGVDKMRTVYLNQTPGSVQITKWTFNIDEQEKQDAYSGDYNHFEFIQSLKIGDEIDVYIGGQWPWMNAYIFGRDFDTFYIRIVDADKYKIYPDWEMKSVGIDNLRRLQPSYTHCQANVDASIVAKVNSNLVDCEWMTAFNTANPFTHYPILFE